MQTPNQAELNYALSSYLNNDITNLIYMYTGNPFIFSTNTKQVELRIDKYNNKPGFLPNSETIDWKDDIIIDWDDDTEPLVLKRNDLRKIDDILYFRYDRIHVFHRYESDVDHHIHIHNATNMSFNETTYPINISQWGGYQIWFAPLMFASCNIIIKARDSPKIMTPNLTNMFSMSKVEGDLSGWDTGNVTDMTGIFSGCELDCDISKWDTSKVTNMRYMFSRCKNFNGDIRGWDTSKVTNMSNMFELCENFNQDLIQWDVSKVVNMRSMFSGCKNLNFDISQWDFMNNKNVHGMLYNCTKLKYKLGPWERYLKNVYDKPYIC